MRIGIDLGGTKIELICINKNNGKELYRQRIPTPKDYNQTIKAIKGLVEQAEKTAGKKGTVGIGIPGTISTWSKRVKNANSTWLNDKPLAKDLEKTLSRAVRIENDANCFTISEATDGAASGKKTVFGVIIGTGCGGGLVHELSSIKGINGIGGEWGHSPLPYPKIYSTDNFESDCFKLFDSYEEKKVGDTYQERGKDFYITTNQTENEWPGPLCYCGKRGCLETWISGPGFKNDYERNTGKSLSTHDIIEAANKGEEKAYSALNRYMNRLARGLSQIINIIDPDAIVLGGGMSNVSMLYSEVPKIWAQYVFSDRIDTPLLSPRYGDSSGVRGAAWLWNDTIIES
jgi:predicted NBD/HSP70 family sugar kinase